jgi:hypothetical protein
LLQPKIRVVAVFCAILEQKAAYFACLLSKSSANGPVADSGCLLPAAKQPVYTDIHCFAKAKQ